MQEHYYNEKKVNYQLFLKRHTITRLTRYRRKIVGILHQGCRARSQ